MRNYSVAILLLLALTALAGAQPPAAKTPVVFTEKDRETALKYLNDTKADFIKEVSGLSDAQLNFRAAPGRWTIAEVAEHIILSEGVILNHITNTGMKSTPLEGKDNYRVRDVGVMLAITNRAQKFQAPEVLRPASRFKTRDELLTNFEKVRNTSIEFMKNNKADMRNTFMENPMMGMIDNFQWFLFMNGHADRHLAQLKEVKTDPAYPKK